MQAVVLAAGESSRFYPFNKQHKCLVKILGEPVIVHTVRAIKRSGITDIVLVNGVNDDFKQVLGNGKKFGVKIRYVVQKNPGGMGDALLCASIDLESDFFLVNSNHVEFDELRKDIDAVRSNNRDIILLAKKNNSERHFGVLKIAGDRAISLVEKPDNTAKSPNFRVIGVYFLNKEFISVLKKAKPEHYSLEHAIDRYAKKGRVCAAVTNRDVLSLKYPWDILSVKNFMLGKAKKNISKKAKISPHARIEGNVVIEEGAVISENAVIKGPAYIGRNVYIGTNVLIRNGTDIEQDSKIGAYMEIKNSLIMQGVTTHSGFIGDSIIGNNTKIGALFGSANVRLDRHDILVKVKGQVVNTGLRSLGVMFGENGIIGERVSTMPGIIIGNNVKIGPSTTVMENIHDNTTYYTKFAGIVSKKKLPPTID